MEWFVLTVVGVGFLVLIVWVNFQGLDDDTPDLRVNEVDPPSEKDVDE